MRGERMDPLAVLVETPLARPDIAGDEDTDGAGDVDERSDSELKSRSISDTDPSLE